MKIKPLLLQQQQQQIHENQSICSKVTAEHPFKKRKNR